MELLAYLRFHGFLLFPGVPNTTAVTQETDQSYGPFQSKLRSNLEIKVDERIHAEKSTALAPWIVGLFVFGGEDPETKCVVGSAFQEGFSHAQNLNAWAKVGAVPLTRNCLQHPKVRRSIGDGNDNQQALARLIQEHNIIACTALTHAGYNGHIMQLRLKPAACTKVVTIAHSQERIELLSQAKSHGSIYAATGGTHLNCNDIFKGMALKQIKILREKLAKEKKVRERQERTESNVLDILRRKGDDVTKLNSGDLSILLTWHQVSKVVDMNKDKKLAAWLRIVGSRKSPPSFEKWTDEDEVRLEEAQSEIVDMAHTAIGHMEELKKKELVLAARAMSQEEFDKLVAARNEATFDLFFASSVGDDDGNGTDANGAIIQNADAANITIGSI